MSKTRPPSREIPADPEFRKNVARAIQRAVSEAMFADNDRSDVSALTVARARTATAPARLALSQPGGAAAQAEAREMYERCLETYRRVVRAQDVALGADDVGAAVAFFVVCNLNALTEIDPPKAHVLALERQMTSVLRHRTGWDGASIVERQLLFEQMAVLSVLVAGMARRARAESPAAVANVQRAARGYLLDFFGLNPDVLALGENGLVISTPEADAPASA